MIVGAIKVLLGVLLIIALLAWIFEPAKRKERP